MFFIQTTFVLNCTERCNQLIVPCSTCSTRSPCSISRTWQSSDHFLFYMFHICSAYSEIYILNIDCNRPIIPSFTCSTYRPPLQSAGRSLLLCSTRSSTHSTIYILNIRCNCLHVPCILHTGHNYVCQLCLCIVVQ